MVRVSRTWGQNTLKKCSSAQNMFIHGQLLQALHTLGELVKTAIFNPTSCEQGQAAWWSTLSRQGLVDGLEINIFGNNLGWSAVSTCVWAVWVSYPTLFTSGDQLETREMGWFTRTLTHITVGQGPRALKKKTHCHKGPLPDFGSPRSDQDPHEWTWLQQCITVPWKTQWI